MTTKRPSDVLEEIQEAESPATSFAIKDCALIAIATGKKAQNLRELRDVLETIQPGSIYYHFWGGRLRPRFDDPEYNNDFATWARHALHDGKSAERLSVIDPTDFGDLEALRQEVVEVLEDRLAESEYVPWARADQQFNFITSQIVVFDTHRRIDLPQELVEVVPSMSVGSVFYHFIDARRRTPDSIDDFRAWLYGFGDSYRELCDRLATVDPYFPTLTQLRDELAAVFRAYFGGDAR